MVFQSGNKINAILDIIDEQYVDSVNMEDLVEGTIPKIFSSSIPILCIFPGDASPVNEDLKAPSAASASLSISKRYDSCHQRHQRRSCWKSRLLPFDRIITINGKTSPVRRWIRQRWWRPCAVQNSTVKLGVQRSGIKGLVHLRRNTRRCSGQHGGCGLHRQQKEPATSRSANLPANTYDEFITAIAKLKKEGSNSFIIDLRGNTGGYMDAANNMVNGIPSGRTADWISARQELARMSIPMAQGTCLKSPLVVLTDEISASASEIFSGAIQDNDRGLIIGRRTYGKGLVQTQIALNDGSAVRLTIARYYTPSGRCIQKEIRTGQDGRIRSGHLQPISARRVWLGRQHQAGWKGQIPHSHGTNRLRWRWNHAWYLHSARHFRHDLLLWGSRQQRTYLHVCPGILQQQPHKLSSFKRWNDLQTYLERQPILNDFANYAETKGLRKRPILINISRQLLETELGPTLYATSLTTKVSIRSISKMIRRWNAVEVLKEGKSFLTLKNGNLQKQSKASKRNRTSKGNFQLIFLLERSHAIFGQGRTERSVHPANCVALYEALPGEVQTAAFIEKWYKSKTLLLPIVEGNDLKLAFMQDRNRFVAESVRHLWNRRQSRLFPKRKLIWSSSRELLSTEPWTEWDEAKVLWPSSPSLPVPKMGICFDFQLFDKIPCEPFDIKKWIVWSPIRDREELMDYNLCDDFTSAEIIQFLWSADLCSAAVHCVAQKKWWKDGALYHVYI